MTRPGLVFMVSRLASGFQKPTKGQWKRMKWAPCYLKWHQDECPHRVQEVKGEPQMLETFLDTPYGSVGKVRCRSICMSFALEVDQPILISETAAYSCSFWEGRTRRGYSNHLSIFMLIMPSLKIRKETRALQKNNRKSWGKMLCSVCHSVEKNSPQRSKWIILSERAWKYFIATSTSSV